MTEPEVESLPQTTTIGDFSIEDDHSFSLPELDNELKVHEAETQQRSKELSDLRALVDKLSQDNKRLTTELALFHEEEEMSIDDFLGKPQGKPAPSEKQQKQSNELTKQLSAAESRLQTLLTEHQLLMDERDMLRQEFTTAQLDWACQLKEEQTRIESFKAILRDVEDTANKQRCALELEVETLRNERVNLRDKIYEEFSEQVRAKTTLVAELDMKLQQATAKQNETNQKLVSVKQQLEQSTRACQQHQKTIVNLEKEKEKLLSETHIIRTSLEAKCADLYATVSQLEYKLKHPEPASASIELKYSEPDESLVSLRAKHQLAKGEIIKIVGELTEQKRKMAELQTDHRLEINRLKSALGELQKCLNLDTFTVDEENQSIQLKIQGLQVDDVSFTESGRDVLEERVRAISASCERVAALTKNLESKLDVSRTEDGDRGLTQTLREEVAVIKDNVVGLVNCISALNRHQSEVTEHLNVLSTRIYDEADCRSAFKMVLRAFRGCCRRSRNRPKKYKYLPIQAGDEFGSP